MNEIAKLQAKYFFAGFKDSWQFPIVFFVFYGSSRLLTNLAYSTAKTAAVFAVSNCILFILNWIFTLPEFPIIRFILWTCPTYALCFEINQSHYQQIATRSFEIFVGKPQPKAANIASIVKLLFKRIFMLSFVAFAIFSSLIPLVGPVVCMIYLNLVSQSDLTKIMPFYAFDFKAINRGWELKQQISYVESHYSYFIGFGKILLYAGISTTILSRIIPSTTPYGFYAFLFPFYIAMANRSQPRPFSDDPITTPPSIPVFYVADKLSENIIGYFKTKSTPKPAEKAQ